MNEKNEVDVPDDKEFNTFKEEKESPVKIDQGKNRSKTMGIKQEKQEITEKQEKQEKKPLVPAPPPLSIIPQSKNIGNSDSQVAFLKDSDPKRKTTTVPLNVSFAPNLLPNLPPPPPPPNINGL